MIITGTIALLAVGAVAIRQHLALRDTKNRCDFVDQQITKATEQIELLEKQLKELKRIQKNTAITRKKLGVSVEKPMDI